MATRRTILRHNVGLVKPAMPHPPERFRDTELRRFSLVTTLPAVHIAGRKQGDRW